MAINRTIKLLMFSDAFIFTGVGLVEPILAVFIKDNIAGGTLFSAGLASALFLVTKSVLQMPFARYVDKHDEKVKWLILGTFIMCLVPFMYIVAKSIYTVYAAQILYGIGSAFAFPTWLGLWSTHLDPHHESFEWSMYSTLVGLGSAASAAVGAAVAEFFGFTVTFLLVEAMLLIGFAFLFFLEWRSKIEGSVEAVHYHRQRRANHRKK